MVCPSRELEHWNAMVTSNIQARRVFVVALRRSFPAPYPKTRIYKKNELLFRTFVVFAIHASGASKPKHEMRRGRVQVERMSMRLFDAVVRRKDGKMALRTKENDANRFVSSSKGLESLAKRLASTSAKTVLLILSHRPPTNRTCTTPSRAFTFRFFRFAIPSREESVTKTPFCFGFHSHPSASSRQASARALASCRTAYIVPLRRRWN